MEFNFQSFAMVAAAHLLALASPGPDFIILVRTSLVQGRNAAINCSLGIALGNAIYIVIALFGVGIIEGHSYLLTLIKGVGMLYLSYLGFQILSNAGNMNLQNLMDSKPPVVKKPLFRGLSSALSNPKNVLFYVSLFTVVARTDIPNFTNYVCALWMAFAVLTWNLAASLAFSSSNVKKLLNSSLIWIERISGAALIGFSIKILLD